MPNAKRAGINTKAGISRLIGRLARVKIAIDHHKDVLERDTGLFDGDARKSKEASKAKLEALQAERDELEDKLNDIRDAIEEHIV